MTDILSLEQRLSINIGQVVVENAKLALMVDTLRAELAAERTRADRAEGRLMAMTQSGQNHLEE
jgi:regulator of replication initiation timing